MGLLSGITSSLKNTFTGSSIRKSLLTGGLTTIHQLNRAEPIRKALGDKLFPDKAELPEAPAAPTMDAAEAAAEDKAAQLRRRRGMAATILGGLDTAQPTTQAASLLGS